MSAERFVRHRWMDFDGYERKERIEYAALATTVAAIGVEAGYRLQHVKERANQPTSLRKKIEQRGIAAMTTLEDDIKDLAGCRVIFYTNDDVTRFLNSGIIDQDFEVLEVKLHHTRRAAGCGRDRDALWYVAGKDLQRHCKAIVDILTRHRYLDVEAKFDALRTLYGWAGGEAEQKPLLDMGKALAKHKL